MNFDEIASCRYLVIGDPIAHSRSPEMQNAAFDALHLGRPYGKLHVLHSEMAEFTAYARTHLNGFNITVPHKDAIIPFLDAKDPVAALAGSFNTVSCRDGKLIGTSTDGYGLEQAVREAFQLDIKGKRVLFTGTGGAARAVAFHFAAQGVAALRLANRTPAKADELAAALHAAYPALPVETTALDDDARLETFIRDSDLLIQSTSVGLKPGDGTPFRAELLAANPDLAVFDAIYRPTPLLQRARELGLATADGRWMLLWQGAKSFEIWTGREAPVEAMRTALERSLKS